MIKENSYLPFVFRYLALPVLFFSLVFVSYGQEEPPRPIKVFTYQHLSFGAFINANSGGTVTIGADGSRSVAGDIIPVFQAMQYHPAIFEVEANPGVLITVLAGPQINLSGSNGGSLILTLGNTLPLSPFVNTTERPFRKQIMVGGTLLIGNTLASPSGEYTGEFFITFIQQ